MESLESLKENARRLANAIGDIEDADRRKANAKKVGKFYKTRNNYSVPKKASDYWWQYERVIRMDETGFLYTLCFQTDCHGKVFIEPERYAYHMQYGTPISAREFGKAWDALVKSISDMTETLERK